MDRRVALIIAAVPLVLYLAASRLGSAPAREGQGATPPPSGPVQVILVKSARDVAAVREVIEPERILAASLDGFVVREGRVVVASVEAAGPLLGLAGWSEVELEIVQVDPRATPAGSAGGADGARREGLSALYAKPTLTLDEAIRALELLR